MYIGVIGGSSCPYELYEDACRIGELIASKGHVLVCGGMGGVMEGASRGAYEAGGTVIGLLPGLSRSDANPYITIPIVTGLGHMRNMLVVVNSDAIIAIDGRWGTMSEIAFCKIHGIPLIGYRLNKKLFNTEELVIANSPEDAVRFATLTERR